MKHGIGILEVGGRYLLHLHVLWYWSKSLSFDCFQLNDKFSKVLITRHTSHTFSFEILKLSTWSPPLKNCSHQMGVFDVYNTHKAVQEISGGLGLLGHPVIGVTWAAKVLYANECVLSPICSAFNRRYLSKKASFETLEGQREKAIEKQKVNLIYLMSSL